MPSAQAGQRVWKICNFSGKSRGNLTECGLSDQKIDHNTVLSAVESRTEHAEPWAVKKAKQKAGAAREQVSNVMANRS